METPTCPTPAEALRFAEAVFHARYAGAAFAYAAGSIMRGQGTLHSDIDLVVVFDRLDAARRESFVAEGVSIEACVHDRETLAWFVADDIAQGRPVILTMIAEGAVIGGEPVRAEALRAGILERLAEGPPPLSPAALTALRYEITDLVDDLRGDRPARETTAIGAILYPKLVELALRGRGRWNGTGKWAPRRLGATDADLARRFETAFSALFATDDRHPVIALAEAELAPHGGAYFAGDCRTAPSSWRVNEGSDAQGAGSLRAGS